MPTLVSRMDAWSIVDIVDSIVFWLVVFYIAWNESATPQWAYLVLFAFLVYYLIKSILRKQGMERAVMFYVLNMIVIAYLMYRLVKK